jgi:hypothetical protein
VVVVVVVVVVWCHTFRGIDSVWGGAPW